jgi:hypothetical protein
MSLIHKKEYCLDVGMDSDVAVLAYHRQLSNIERKKAKNELEANKVVEEKVKCYREMCAKTPDNILANYIYASLNGDGKKIMSRRREHTLLLMLLFSFVSFFFF